MPFSNEYMQYSYTTHQYIITPKAMQDLLLINLDDYFNSGGTNNESKLPEIFLNRVSNLIYNYIYKYTMNKPYLEYLMANFPPLREVMQEILLDQASYMLTNGDIGNFSGINLQTGKIMELSQMRNKVLVSATAQMIMEQPIAQLGFPLLYRGVLSPLNQINYSLLKAQGVY